MVRIFDAGPSTRQFSRRSSVLPLLALSAPMFSIASASAFTSSSSLSHLSGAALLGGAVLSSLAGTVNAFPVPDAQGQPNQWLGQNPGEVSTCLCSVTEAACRRLTIPTVEPHLPGLHWLQSIAYFSI